MPIYIDKMPETELLPDKIGIDTQPDEIARLFNEIVADQAPDEPEPISVARIVFHPLGRQYAYSVRGTVAIGDQLLVDSPLSGVEAVPVVALGRGDYQGPLKMAMKVA